jgi:hypothetical protein
MVLIDSIWSQFSGVRAQLWSGNSVLQGVIKLLLVIYPITVSYGWV